MYGPATRIPVMCRTALPLTNSRKIARWLASGGNLELRLNTDGTISLLDYLGAVKGTTTTSLIQNEWSTIGWEVNVYAGTVKVYMDGVEEISATPTMHEYYSLSIGCVGTESQAIDLIFDDIANAISDDSCVVPANGKVLAPMVPVAGTQSYNQWIGSYSDVDEIPHTDDTDYIYDANHYNYRESYPVSNPLPSGEPHNGFCTTNVVKLFAGSYSPTRIGFVAAGTPYIVTHDGNGPLHYALCAVHCRSDLGLTWAQIDAMQVLIQTDAALQNTKYVTQLMMHIDQPLDAPNAPTSLLPTGDILEQRPTFGGDYSQGDAGVMAAAQVQIWNSAATVLIWDSGSVTNTGSRFQILDTYSLTRGTSYKWKARCKDSNGIWGDWTSLQTILIGSAPTTPTDCDPTGGENLYGDQTPLLSWTHNDPNSDAQSGARVELRENVSDNLVSGYPKTLAAILDAFAGSGAIANDDSEPSGKAWTQEGTWSRLDDAVRCTALNARYRASLWQDMGSADGKVYCRLKYAGAAALNGIAFRIKDFTGSDEDYLYVYLFADATYGGVIRLGKCVSGSQSTIETSSGIDMVIGGWYPVEIRFVGDQVSVYVNGIQAIAPQTITDHEEETGVGLYAEEAHATDTRWDDFIATAAAAEDEEHETATALDYGTAYKWKVKTRDGYLLGAESAYNIFMPVLSPTVTIDFPAEDESVVTPTPQTQWTYSGTLNQNKYRTIIYDSALETVIYDSGIVASSNEYHDIPTGYLHTGNTYKLKVYVWDTDDTQAESTGWRTFTTAWTPPAVIANVALTPVISGNPHMQIDWDESGLEFVEYLIYRRKVGTSAWTRMVAITTKATTTYKDYLVPLNEDSQYKVTQVELISGDEVESGDSSTPSDSVDVAGMIVLHDLTDATSYALFSITISRSFDRRRDQKEVLYWGRTAPVLEIGKANYRRFKVSWALREADEGTLDDLQALYESNEKLCYRDSRSTKIFCNMDKGYRYHHRRPSGLRGELHLIEAQYTEEVSA